MQYQEWYPGSPASWHAGFMAVCERAPEANWYAAIFYHAVFLNPDLTPVRLPPWLPAPIDHL